MRHISWKQTIDVTYISCELYKQHIDVTHQLQTEDVVYHTLGMSQDTNDTWHGESLALTLCTN